jgi:hypothetical protein
MGWMDAEGYLYLTDRDTDMILVGGANVYRPHLLPARSLVGPGAGQVAAPRASRRGAGGRLPLVRGGARPGMWNGVGPRFLKYEREIFGHIDEMKDSGFRGIHARAPNPVSGQKPHLFSRLNLARRVHR